jgi:hypothetical protein
MLKKTEIILASILIISLGMKFLEIPGSAPLLILSGCGLSLMYLFFSFLLLNDIKLRNLVKNESYNHTSVSTIVIAIFTGFSISAFFNGFVFKIMHWPGGSIMLYGGLTITIICLASSLFIQPKISNSNENILDSELLVKEANPINFDFRKNVLLRIVPAIITTVVLLFLKP